MLMISKRKLTSGVAILCAFMILIGIFPMNLFSNNKAEAASDAKYQSGYIYFDVSNMVGSGCNESEWVNGNKIYMLYVSGWDAPGEITKVTDTMYGVNVSAWGNKSNSGEIVFSTVSNWDDTKTANYRRTSLSGYNIATAEGRVFSWDKDRTETIDGHPAFVLTSKTYTVGDYIEKQSLAGKPINFKDMTETVSGDVTATFTDDSGTSTVSCILNNSQVTIPADVNNNAYTTVEFKNGDTSLGKYNLFDKSSTGVEAVKYDETTCNTFYYGATEKPDNTKVSCWGAGIQSGTVSGKLYLDDVLFPTTGTAPTINVNGTSGTFTVDGDETAYSYNVSSIRKSDIITITYNDTKYHFMWSDEKSNMVSIGYDVATVSGTYGNSNTIYFDATLSKLSYEGTATNAPIPVNGGKIYCYLFNDTTGKSALKEMEKLNSVTKGSNTWSDVYAYELTQVDIDAGYSNVIFYSNTKAEWPANKASQTVDLDFPKNTSKTCFYADSSDSCIYNSGDSAKRSGYWDRPYKIRDAEKGKTTSTDIRDVVDIKQEEFIKDSNALYVNSTFYDYYTDYELNGSNRDDYGSSTGASQQNWVNFRQFDQALSDYYEKKGVSKKDAIYTGHFQPTVTGWGTAFSDIADTLELYGWDSYNTFISNNNSNVDSDGIVKTGSDGYYKYATQGIVNNNLDNGVLKTHDNSAASPYFDEDFLNGNNSKNTKLGEVYKDVAFPFTKQDVFNNGVEYWCFDSSNKTLAMQQDKTTGEYYLKDYTLSSDRNWSKNLNANGKYSSGDTPSTTYGLFPFNYGDKSSTNDVGSTYNYGYGTKLEFNFRLTEDGTVLDSKGNPADIQFLFSGDDDVWVYIDGNLALDVGGAHGQVTGTINFGGTSTTKTSTVNYVKKSANNSTKTGTNVTSNFELKGKNTDEHTLTMYYMERGMWESNMRVAFNFPDENQLEVEKQVDTSNVNENFVDFFSGTSMFSFDIKNLATHYGTKDVTTGGTVKPITYSAFNDNTVTLIPTTGNTFAYQSSYTDVNNKVADNVIKWYSNQWNDNHQEYTDRRLGTIEFNDPSSIDISDMEYLSFDMCVEKRPIQIGGVYIRLTDNNGKKADAFLDSQKLYGTPIVQQNTWSTFKVILSKLNYENDFDKTNVKSISFQYDQENDSHYWSNVYLDNFIFQPSTQFEGTVGFVTKQSEIPDYGSAQSGKLEIPNGAKYTSNLTDGKVNSIGSDGKFALMNGEEITFSDQFRRGSYIYLNENLTPAQKKLFNTSYTVYEDGKAVTRFNTNNCTYITNTGTKNLKDVDVTDIVDNDGNIIIDVPKTVDDGRVEKVVTTGPEKDTEGNIINPSQGNSYNGNRPTEKAFVFRSYSDPDSTLSSTKLKIVYTNTVKTSNITIYKKQAADDAMVKPLTGKYKFYVEFTNIGGTGLVKPNGTNSVVLGPFELAVGDYTTIKGIPVGTQYKIHEVVARQTEGVDTAVVDNILGYVSQTQPTLQDKVDFTKDTLTVTDDEKYDTWSVSGSVSYNAQEFSYDFYNIYMPTISLNVQKTWNVPTGYTLPTSVTLKLQRRSSEYSADDTKWEDVPGYKEFTLSSDDGWSKKINDLNKYVDTKELNLSGGNIDDTGAKRWQYRILEINSDDSGFFVSYGDAYDGTQPNPEENPYTLTVNNKLKASIKITKVDSSNFAKTLSGAVFELYDENPNNNSSAVPIATSAQTGDDGIATFDNLEYKTYYIKEKTAPSGYQISNAVQEINLADLSDSEFVKEVQFKNSSIVMPAAGGEGKNPFNFVLFGAITIALAGGILLLNKKYAFLHIGKSSKEVQ